MTSRAISPLPWNEAESVGETVDRTKEMHLAWLARSFGRPDYMPLTAEDLEALSRAGDVVHFEEGSYLFREGEVASAAFVLERGGVELLRNGSSAYRCLCRIHPGAVLGDAAMFLGEGHFASAKAVTPVTAFRLDRDRVVVELANRPAIALRWLIACLRQYQSCQRRIMALMHRAVHQRIAFLLLDDADESGAVNLTQDEMAQLLGVTRSAINRGVSKLRKKGLIENRYGATRIIDRAGLDQLAGQS